MTALIFDIEANGLGEIKIDKKKNLIKEADTVHLLVLRRYPDGATLVFRKNDEMDTIQEGWDILKRADTVIGHNIIGYDLPVLRRLYGGDIKGRIYDTLVAAKVLYPDAKNHPFGGNSLEDFGKLLGCHKGDYTGGWERWSQEMEDYCIQDTAVSQKILDYLRPRVAKFKRSVMIEHEVAKVCADAQDNGVDIDEEGAESLIERLEVEQAEITQKLHQVFPPIIEVMKTPKYWEDPESGERYRLKGDAPGPRRKHLVKGPMKTKEHPFNVGSANQIADRLKERYGWEAPKTEKGNPSVTEESLKGLPYPEADLILRLMMIDKRLQHLVDWTRRARASRTPGRIHPQINPLGCATSRASHSQPNQTACPKVLNPELRGYEGRYGWEMRSLWRPRDGWVQVGGDASGLELRCLGDALAIYDKGAYAREVINGDIHTLNQQAGGLYSRDQAKTTIYAYLYGAGNAHIGELITEHTSLPPEMVQKNHEECEAWVKARKGKKVAKGHRRGMPYERVDWLAMKGAEFRNSFESKIPALGRLSEWCRQCASQRGFVPLADGRHAPCRSEHSALNTLLQGNGAIIMKVAMVLFVKELKKLGWYKTRCAFMLWPHDEFQLESEPEIAERVGQMLVESIVKAGKMLRLRCPLDGEYKIGKSWAECH